MIVIYHPRQTVFINQPQQVTLISTSVLPLTTRSINSSKLECNIQVFSAAKMGVKCCVQKQTLITETQPSHISSSLNTYPPFLYALGPQFDFPAPGSDRPLPLCTAVKWSVSEQKPGWDFSEWKQAQHRARQRLQPITWSNLH